MPPRRLPRPRQLLLPELVVAVRPAPPPPPSVPDPEREQREARSAATLTAVIRNLASGVRAADAEVA